MSGPDLVDKIYAQPSNELLLDDRNASVTVPTRPETRRRHSNAVKLLKRIRKSLSVFEYSDSDTQ